MLNLYVVAAVQPHSDKCGKVAFIDKVNLLAQPIYSCPFCDTPAWRTRYMLWKHMHVCIRRQREYIPDVTPHVVDVDKELAIPA